MSHSKIKQKKCKNCKELFTPFKTTQIVCSVDCSIQYQKEKKAKDTAKKNRERKRLLTEELMTYSDWKQKLQKVFNQYIRLRDINRGCVSCDKPLQNRKFDAGHFYPTTYEGLRYNELNVHGQCVPCNRNLHGNIHEYRKRITNRITKEELKWLDENRHVRLDLKVYEIKELINIYKEKIKHHENN